jgi:hypothetical protein
MCNNTALKIGTSNQGFPSYHNFSGLVRNVFSFRRTHDIIAVLRYLSYKTNASPPPQVKTFLNTFHFDLGLNVVDVLHFFNSTSASRMPWGVIFETALGMQKHSYYLAKCLALNVIPVNLYHALPKPQCNTRVKRLRA